MIKKMEYAYTTLEEVYNYIRITILKGESFNKLQAHFFDIPIEIEVISASTTTTFFTDRLNSNQYNISITITPPKFIELIKQHSYPYILIKFIMLNTQTFKITNDTFNYDFSLTKTEFDNEKYKNIISSIYHLCQYLHMKVTLPKLLQNKTYKEAIEMLLDIVYFDYGLVIDKEQLHEFREFLLNQEIIDQ